jgi:hypothetical protein
MIGQNAMTGMLLLGVMMTGPTLGDAQSAEDHAVPAAEHTGHAGVVLQLNDGRRWRTDAPLREGMERIRSVVTAADASAPRAGGVDAEAARSLAAAVDETIAYMISNCRLEPAADANLHILLARLSVGAAAVRANPQSATGLPSLLDVLEVYPGYFEHAGWQRAKGDH